MTRTFLQHSGCVLECSGHGASLRQTVVRSHALTCVVGLKVSERGDVGTRTAAAVQTHHTFTDIRPVGADKVLFATFGTLVPAVKGNRRL